MLSAINSVNVPEYSDRCGYKFIDLTVIIYRDILVHVLASLAGNIRTV